MDPIAEGRNRNREMARGLAEICVHYFAPSWFPGTKKPAVRDWPLSIGGVNGGLRIWISIRPSPWQLRTLADYCGSDLPVAAVDRLDQVMGE
jgi:hypothetical protein